jgi:hypothetical protein
MTVSEVEISILGDLQILNEMLGILEDKCAVSALIQQYWIILNGRQLFLIHSAGDEVLEPSLVVIGKSIAFYKDGQLGVGVKCAFVVLQPLALFHIARTGRPASFRVKGRCEGIVHEITAGDVIEAMQVIVANATSLLQLRGEASDHLTHQAAFCLMD